jgi:type VI secretion system secreted protein Hcp
MAIFIKFASIEGSSTDNNFKNQVEVSSLQWGAGVGLSSASGGDRSHTTPSVSEITVTKILDKSTEELFKSLLKAENIGKATISFVAASKGESVAYATIEIEDVIVSGYSMSSGGDRPSESLSLNFTKFDYMYTGRDAKQAGKPTHLIYSLVDNKVG